MEEEDTGCIYKHYIQVVMVYKSTIIDENIVFQKTAPSGVQICKMDVHARSYLLARQSLADIFYGVSPLY